jgi:hypothetical protein
MSKKCKECHHIDYDEFGCTGCSLKGICNIDENQEACSEFTPIFVYRETLFDRITASPEVLAEEFVEMMYDRVAGDYRYYSMLTGEFYNSSEEAIAATLEKLKEVEK